MSGLLRKKEATNVGRLKAFWLVLLTMSVAAVLSAGTLAAYNQTFDLTGTIGAERMVFNVNGSGEESQSMGVRELWPGENTTFEIEIDSTGTEVALDVALKVTSSGSDLPPGLSVRVDGASVGDSGTGTCTATYSGMKGSSRTVPVVVSWNATPSQLKAQYGSSRDFNLSLLASVTATQAVT